MKLKISLKILLIVLICSTRSLYSQNSIQQKINSISAESFFKHASISFEVRDLTTNKRIAVKNHQTSLIPASVFKLFSTASSLELLGPQHKFHTYLQYDGFIDEGGQLIGNVYIKGGGDPALGSEHFKNNYGDYIQKWVSALQNKGIKSIKGKIIGDATYFDDNVVPDGWIWSDIGNYYGAGPNGLSVHDNTCKVKFKSGPNAGDSTVFLGTEPEIPGLQVDNRVLASNKNSDNCWVFGAPYSNYRVLEGTIPKGRSLYQKTKASIPDPAYFLASLVAKRCAAVGITTLGASTLRLEKLSGDSRMAKRFNLDTVYSPTLKKIVERTNHKSVNLYAEHVLIQAALKRDPMAKDTESAADVVDTFWENKGVTGLFLHDGSGLSRKNAVSAHGLVKLLSIMNQSKNKKAFYESLPISGKTGTIRSMCKNTVASGKVHAKSGSMSNVRSYAGYVETVSGKKLAFAIVFNNFTCSSRVVKQRVASLFDTMAQY